MGSWAVEVAGAMGTCGELWLNSKKEEDFSAILRRQAYGGQGRGNRKGRKADERTAQNAVLVRIAPDDSG